MQTAKDQELLVSALNEDVTDWLPTPTAGHCAAE
jgi:hypothetical protein